MQWGVYVFFATALICASVFAYFFIHDTKGLRMDQMDRLFGFTKRDEFVAEAFQNAADRKTHATTTMDDESEHHEKNASTRTEAV